MTRFGKYPGPIVATALMLVATEVQADQIRFNGRDYSGAHILGFEDGNLRFRADNGVVQIAWVGDVELINVDSVRRFADFNDAEQFLARGEPEKSLVRYERALRLCEDWWIDLVRSRLLIACDRAERIDQVVLNLIRLAKGSHGGPRVAAGLIPSNLPSSKDESVMRALDQLEAGLRAADTPDVGTVLRLTELAVLDATGDARRVETAKRIAQAKLPESVRCARAYEFVERAFVLLPMSDVGSAEMAALDDAIRFAPQGQVAAFLILKGTALLTQAKNREDWIRAAWPFMRVVIHLPQDARVPEALLGAAAALEKLNRNGQAVELLQECLARKGVPPSVRSSAQSALKRLKP